MYISLEQVRKTQQTHPPILQGSLYLQQEVE